MSSKNTSNIRWDVRLLIGTGVLCALITIFIEGNKAFTVVSGVSSSLIGAGVGVLKERKDNNNDNEEY